MNAMVKYVCHDCSETISRIFGVVRAQLGTEFIDVCIVFSKKLLHSLVKIVDFQF